MAHPNGSRMAADGLGQFVGLYNRNVNVGASPSSAPIGQQTGFISRPVLGICRFWGGSTGVFINVIYIWGAFT